MRILVIDDEPALREAYQRVFAEPLVPADTAAQALAAELFDACAPSQPAECFDVTYVAGRIRAA